MPLRDTAGFVIVRADMGDDFGLAEKALVETEIGGSGVDRVGIKDHEPINSARVEIGDEALEISHLIGWNRNCGLGGDGDCLADVSESLIDGERESGDRFVLIETGNDSTLAAVGLEIFGEDGEEVLLLGGPGVLRRA